MNRWILCGAASLTILLAGCAKRSAPAPANASISITKHLPVPREDGFTESAIEGEEDVSPHYDLYDIAIEDAPIDQVVDAFIKDANAQIIAVPDNMSGYATVNLSEVAWAPALKAILAMHDYTLIEHTPGTGEYVIVETTPDMPPPIVTTVIHCASPQESTDIATAIKALWADKDTFKIEAVPSNSSLVASGTENDIVMLESIVEKLQEEGVNDD